MNRGELSERIRQRAIERYVMPAAQRGQDHFSIAVKDLMRELEAEGFPPRHQHQFCTAVQTGKFLAEHGLEIASVDGPRSKKSTTVVVHYRLKRRGHGSVSVPTSVPAEDPAARALRLTEKIRGLFHEDLKQYGGATGFMRWIRSDEDDAA